MKNKKEGSLTAEQIVTETAVEPVIESRELRKLDALIAEKVMGWPVVSVDDMDADSMEPVVVRPFEHDPEWGTFRGGVPWQPSTDVNACFEAQARVIEKVGMPRYYRTLCEEWRMSSRPSEYHLVEATAAQRCRAMLRASEEK